MARHLWLLKWKDEAMIERLMAGNGFGYLRIAWGQ
jgi:hypothetical protein